jgi:hypothetical protein
MATMSSSAPDEAAFPVRDARGAPRKRLSIPVILRPEKSKRMHTMLRDLSLSGFSASAMFRIPVGTVCWLTLPGREPMEARVVWWEGGLVGCAFAKLIGSVTYDAIIERGQAEADAHR